MDQQKSNDDNESDSATSPMVEKPMVKDADSPKKATFDDVLQQIGQFGPYQRRIYFLLFLPTIFCAMHKLAWVFLGAQVNHRCKLPSEPSNVTYNAIETNETCYYYLNGQKSECDHGYVYDKTNFGSSAVMDWNMVCGDKAMRATAQAIFMLGVLIGSYLFGEMSDRIGRKPTFFLSVVLQIIFGLLAGFAPEYYSFVIARLIIGATTSGVFLVSYVLAMESVGPKYRVIAGTLCQYYYTFGLFVMAFIAYFLNHDWKLLQIVLTAPSIVFLTYWWIVPESVRWLIRKGKYDQAKIQIEKIANENKTELPEAMMDQMIEQCKLDDQDKKGTISIFNIFTRKNLLKNSLIIFFLWFVNSGTYYGLSLGASNLGGNPYLNFMISAAVEIPAYAINLMFLNNPKVGRRLGHSTFMLIAGLALTITIFVPEDLNSLIIALSMIGKLAITTSYGVIYIYTAELFPTVIRNAGVGTSSLCARIGGIICPYINMLIDTWRPLPLIIYGIMAFIGGMLTLLLPETLNKELPETIEDGEKFASQGNICCSPKQNET